MQICNSKHNQRTTTKRTSFTFHVAQNPIKDSIARFSCRVHSFVVVSLYIFFRLLSIELRNPFSLSSVRSDENRLKSSNCAWVPGIMFFSCTIIVASTKLERRRKKAKLMRSYPKCAGLKWRRIPFFSSAALCANKKIPIFLHCMYIVFCSSLSQSMWFFAFPCTCHQISWTHLTFRLIFCVCANLSRAFASYVVIFFSFALCRVYFIFHIDTDKPSRKSAHKSNRTAARTNCTTWKWNEIRLALTFLIRFN